MSKWTRRETHRYDIVTVERKIRVARWMICLSQVDGLCHEPFATEQSMAVSVGTCCAPRLHRLCLGFVAAFAAWSTLDLGREKKLMGTVLVRRQDDMWDSSTVQWGDEVMGR